MEVRDATAEDLDAIVDIAARGFEDDPVMGWVLRDPRTRLDGLRIGFTGLAHSFFDDHSVVTLADDACVAMWRAPSWSASPPNDDGGSDQRESPFTAEEQERWRILGETIEAAHPRDRPHWYLNVIATVPDRRGRGLGARALASMLERLDAGGSSAYLESSNPRNMSLYRRHGFEDCGDPIELPDGPSLYPMWRAPGPVQSIRAW